MTGLEVHTWNENSERFFNEILARALQTLQMKMNVTMICTCDVLMNDSTQNVAQNDVTPAEGGVCRAASNFPNECMFSLNFFCIVDSVEIL